MDEVHKPRFSPTIANRDLFQLSQGTLECDMGRQTAVALSEEDENNFLGFLRADADIRIYQWAASTTELLVVPRFPPRGPSESYRLWNTAFPWEPEYGQWQRVGVTPQLAEKFYLKNTAGAPLLEYSRQSFGEAKPLMMYGRIYWNTDFAIYRGPEYDTAAFGRWYDHVVRWLRKNGRKVEITRGWCQYWLPGAWAQRPLDLRS